MFITLNSSENLLSLLLKGGWLMVPLALLSLISVYIIIDRLLTYRNYLSLSTPFLQTIEEALSNGNLSDLKHICAKQDNIVSKVLNKVLLQPKTSNTSLLLESESNKIVAFLEEKLSLLATIAGVAPMIGFLGTVTGMIQTFMAIAQDRHHLSAQAFSGGIYEAMVTTVAGLMVGIIAYLGYNYFTARVTKATGKVTYLVNLFLANLT